MWLFLGVGVPAVRRPDLHLHAATAAATPQNLGPDQVYDIPFTSVELFVLLMSSLTMVLAVSAARRRDDRNTTRVAVRHRPAGRDASSPARSTSSRRSTARASGFTTSLFGVQLLHAHRLPRRPRLGRHHHAAVARGHDPARPCSVATRPSSIEIVGLYWHFVDIVWILIFTLVYLIPREHRHDAPTPSPSIRAHEVHPQAGHDDQHHCDRHAVHPAGAGAGGDHRPRGGAQLHQGRLRAVLPAAAADHDGDQVLHRRPLLHAPEVRQQALRRAVLHGPVPGRSASTASRCHVPLLQSNGR